jgi:hypothetical protein
MDDFLWARVLSRDAYHIKQTTAMITVGDTAFHVFMETNETGIQALFSMLSFARRRC